MIPRLPAIALGIYCDRSPNSDLFPHRHSTTSRRVTSQPNCRLNNTHIELRPTQLLCSSGDHIPTLRSEFNNYTRGQLKKRSSLFLTAARAQPPHQLLPRGLVITRAHTCASASGYVTNSDTRKSHTRFIHTLEGQAQLCAPFSEVKGQKKKILHCAPATLQSRKNVLRVHRASSRSSCVEHRVSQDRLQERPKRLT